VLKNTPWKFWSLVKVVASGCWEWQGAKNADGYGNVRYGGKHWRAHRLAYFLWHGDVPPYLRHTCHKPLCCNPQHLVPGDAQSNMDDKVAANRQAKGETIGVSKLTKHQVKQIKTSPLNAEQLAREFGVYPSTVRAILAGRTWRHVQC